MIEVEAGKCYVVHHARKGGFTVRIDEVRGTCIEDTITKGVANYISEPNRGPGEKIILSTDSKLMRFDPVET
jgi:hypothetical protein